MLVTGEVPTELHALPGFRSELELDKLCNGFQASAGGVVLQIYVEFIALACLVDG